MTDSLAASAESGTPSAWVLRFLHLIPAGGRVLDLACGKGRHTRLLAGRGHPVTAVDIDVSGLAGLRNDPLIDIREA
ncbi:MAG: methyltransferase domain-containing protein, partial [Gammaproteobacteria bacterium]|nr:methyltransferase domain-containing protein [Gammaproteobacteria bacterium]